MECTKPLYENCEAECPESVCKSTVPAVKESFVTGKGDQAAHALDGEWIQLEGSPFGHGCCDCGLFHVVNYRIIDDSGEEVLNKGLHLQMQWGRDQGETERLRQFQTGGRVCNDRDEVRPVDCNGEGLDGKHVFCEVCSCASGGASYHLPPVCPNKPKD